MGDRRALSLAAAAGAGRRDRLEQTPEQSAVERYRALFADAPVGIFVSRPDGRLVDCNAALAKILGAGSPAEIIDTDMSPYHVRGQRERWLAQLAAHHRLESRRGQLRRCDGRTIEVMTSSVATFDPGGALSEIRGFVFELTSAVEGGDLLADRERRFRSVFNDAADAMLILDGQRTVVDANRTAGIVFGLEPANLVGQTLDQRIAAADRPELEAGWRELLTFGEAKREHDLPVNGESRRIACSYRATPDERRHLCIIRDVTEQSQLEARLLQSEKIESIGRLAGGIAHDFNNLLTAILGYTELLLKKCGPKDANRADLEEIQHAGQRAAALTQRLLAYSRKQVLVPREVDLNSAIDSLRVMLTRLIRADIKLRWTGGRAPAFIRIDPTQLEQVIINLVLNARDALPAGGTIGLEVARVQLSPADLPPGQPAAAGEYIRLTVSDNGIGILPEVRPHLFEPFFTTKEVGQGTGLGLASVHGIVRQSNGFISVESEPGKGTTFTMHFPAIEPPTPTVPAPAGAAASHTPGSETILLVEDEEAVRGLIAAVLRQQGYRVLEAASPAVACQLFDAHAAEIDLLLSDVVMPEMNGPALAQRLVATRPQLRILLISGYTDGGFPFSGVHPSISFLSKPFQPSLLIARIREMLARSIQ